MNIDICKNCKYHKLSLLNCEGDLYYMICNCNDCYAYKLDKYLYYLLLTNCSYDKVNDITKKLINIKHNHELYFLLKDINIIKDCPYYLEHELSDYNQ